MKPTHALIHSLYFEVTLKTAALAQVGLAANTFTCSSIAGEGVGDDSFSWVSGAD